MSVVNIMKEAAEASGCEHRGYNQMRALGLDQGICYGLAVCWLRAVAGGSDDRDQFFRDVNVKNSERHKEAHSYWEEQRNLSFWLAGTGLQKAKNVNKEHKEKTFIAKYELDYYTQKNLYAGEDMKALSKWMRAALGQRYFLLHIPKHTMAAAGSKTGVLRFFDPNGGVVSSRSTKNFSDCLLAYFNDPLIKKHYASGSGRVELKVEKYK